jgi:hypothetical protein
MAMMLSAVASHWCLLPSPGHQLWYNFLKVFLPECSLHSSQKRTMKPLGTYFVEGGVLFSNMFFFCFVL